MAEQSSQVHLASFGHVYIAPLGTTMPTDVTTVLNAAFAELGYLSEDGVSVTPNVDTNDIKAWQTPVPVKTVVTSVGLQCKFSMMQITSDTTAAYFFGSAWTRISGTLGKLIFSSTVSTQERCLVIEWTDEVGNVNRLCFGRGMLTDRDAMQLQRTENLAFGVTFEALDLNGQLGYLLSSDTDLIPLS